MSEIDHAELRRLAEAIGTGDWFFDSYCNKCTGHHLQTPDGGTGIVVHRSDNPLAMFIAAMSPDAIIALLDQIEQQGREIERLTNQHAFDQRGDHEYGVFRGEVRAALFSYWPNNLGVGNDEIVDAITHCVAELAAARKSGQKAVRLELAVRRRHFRCENSPGFPAYCPEDKQNWPCAMIQEIDAALAAGKEGSNGCQIG